MDGNYKKKSRQKLMIKNGIYIYILNFFSTIMPMFTIPYVTRVLGTTTYGKFSIAFNIVSYFQVFVEYGFVLYGAREIAVVKKESDVNKIFSEIFFARVGLGLCSFVLLLFYILFFVSDKEIIVSMLILFLMVIGSVFQQNWLLQGMERMQYITIVGIVSRLLSFFLVFVMINNSNQIYLYCFLYALTNFGIGICGFGVTIYRLKVRFVKVSISGIVSRLREASYIFVSSIGAKILTSFGITILGITYTESDVGIYSAVSKIPNVIVMLFTPISQVIYPYVSKRFSVSFFSGLKTTIKIGIPVLIIFTLMSSYIVIDARTILSVIYGESYVQSYRCLQILMLWILFAILNNFLGIQILLASNHSREYGHAFVLSGITAVVFNIILVSASGSIGVAIATVISEIFLTVMLTYYIVKMSIAKYKI